MTKTNENKDKKEASFMLPIWLITILSMAGTTFVSYSVHVYFLNKAHRENMKQVELVQYRTSKFNEYKFILEKEGKLKAEEYLNKE